MYENKEEKVFLNEFHVFEKFYPPCFNFKRKISLFFLPSPIFVVAESRKDLIIKIHVCLKWIQFAGLFLKKQLKLNGSVASKVKSATYISSFMNVKFCAKHFSLSKYKINL